MCKVAEKIDYLAVSDFLSNGKRMVFIFLKYQQILKLLITKLYAIK